MALQSLSCSSVAELDYRQTIASDSKVSAAKFALPDVLIA